MAWTRIDDKFLMNPKIQSAGVHGMALYLSGLIYSNTNLTDGYIPDVMLPVLCGLAYQTPSKKVAEILVDLNLWERVPGGYQIHDFLTFNKSKREIDLLNKQRAANGAKNKPEQKRTDTKPGTETGAETGTETGTRTLSGSVPINPNTLIPLLPNDLKQPQQQLNARNAFSAYQNGIGLLNGHIAELLKQAVDEFSDEWVTAAIEEAVEQNKRNWRYIEAILKRWQIDGFKVDTRVKKPNNGYKPTKQLSAGLDEILAGAPIFAEDK